MVSSCGGEHGYGFGRFSDGQVGLCSRTLSSAGGLAGVIDGCSVDAEIFAGRNGARCTRLDMNGVGGTHCRITHIKHIRIPSLLSCAQVQCTIRSPMFSHNHFTNNRCNLLHLHY